MNLMLFLSKSEESVGLFLSRLNTRKNLLFLVVMMFCIKGYAQRVYNFSFSINDYSVSTDGGITSVSSSLPGLIYSNDTSKPNIPAVPIRILLHEDSTSAVYNVEYEKTLISSNITMEACRGALTTNGEIYQGLPYALSSIEIAVLIHRAGLQVSMPSMLFETMRCYPAKFISNKSVRS